MDSGVERSGAEVPFNLAYRVLGSETDAAEAVRKASFEIGEVPDGDRQFALQLLIATRKACHDLATRRRQPPPAASESPREIAAASMRLPIRQREALALRELGRLSYGEIATILETGHNAVAQLISRARINLSDELRGTVLASIAAPSPECERALPLIAMRNDGQLEADSPDAVWLDGHLNACERCRLGIGAMREAAASYASWAPIAAPAGLFATTAQAMPVEAEAAPTPVPEQRDRPRRRLALAAALASLLLLVGIAAASLRDDAAPPLDPATDAAPPASAGSPTPEARVKTDGKEGRRRQGKKPDEAALGSTSRGAGDPSSAPVAIPVSTEGSSDQPASRPEPKSPGTAAVQPTQKAPAPRQSSRLQPQPDPTAAAAPQPVPEAAPVSEEPQPEEATFEPPGRTDPPGKAVGRPSK